MWLNLEITLDIRGQKVAVDETTAKKVITLQMAMTNTVFSFFQEKIVVTPTPTLVTPLDNPPVVPRPYERSDTRRRSEAAMTRPLTLIC